MHPLASLLRPNILQLQPYASARDEFKGKASVFLDANENNLGGPLPEEYYRYPDPRPVGLLQRLAELKGVCSDRIFVGNGSDEAIDLLLRAFCIPGRDNIILMPPTYGMYAVQANIHGVEVRKAPLMPDFNPDWSAVLSQTDDHSKLLFICSPNNPTGNCIPDAFILQALENFPGIVVLDEAYIDFASRPSWLTRLEAFPRLVVLQTLSKAWGLAGLRIGMAYGDPFLIETLNKIKYPYNLNVVTTQLAEQALQREDIVREKIRHIQSERARIGTALRQCPEVQQVFPSEANFLLVRTADADNLYAHLCKQGIVVRNRSRELHCHSCLRITIGTPDENDRLLHHLQSV
jgi:histidinol-phosphate aminotransferase